MTFLQNINWQEILKIWQKSEEAFWKDFYIKKGFNNWLDWRMSYFKDDNLNEKKWSVYKVSPQEVSEFHVSPFYGWEKAKDEVKSKKFKNIIHAPILKGYKKFEEIKKDFPKEIFLIGLRQGDGIRIIDGHHRAAVLSQVIENGENIDTKIIIYLGKSKYSQSQR